MYPYLYCYSCIQSFSLCLKRSNALYSSGGGLGACLGVGWGFSAGLGFSTGLGSGTGLGFGVAVRRAFKRAMALRWLVLIFLPKTTLGAILGS